MKKPMYKAVYCLVCIACCLLPFSTAWAQQVQATWMNGDSLFNIKAFYGTQGVANKRNQPGHRTNAIYWTDADGVFWLYGGELESAWENGASDLWKWDGTYWTWVAGDSTLQGKPNYGAKGVPAADNTPGPIEDATSAYHNGILYLFGGYGLDADGQWGWLNNLWVWDGTFWTWLSGDAKAYAPGVLPLKGEIEASAIPGSRHLANSIIDSRGRFWLYAGFGQYSETEAGHLDDLWMWDGENWIWMSGSGVANQKAIYGELGKTDVMNNPGGRHSSHVWFTEEGNIQVFAGSKTIQFGQTSTVYADLWEWDGTNWTWLYGDSTEYFANHRSLYTYDEANRIGHRHAAAYWKDTLGDIWIFGGIGRGDTSSGALNDLWRWDGKHWYWMGGESEANGKGVYGVKEVYDAKNWPGARADAAFLTDNDGVFWLYGGTTAELSKKKYSDLWRLDPQLSATLVIKGNDLVIEDDDLIPRPEDGTDFGAVATTNVPIRQTYVVENVGSLPAYLPNTFALGLQNNEGSFRIVGRPQKSPIEPGDTVQFTIEFQPTEAKDYECEVVFKSNSDNPEYLFRIQGRGIENTLIRVEEVTCNSLDLYIKDQGVDHYTVLVADSGARVELPFDSDNYNYSPNYLRAPFLRKSKTRILYQGPDTVVAVKGLIANRSYQFIVVAGEGLPGNTVYFNDRAQLLYVRTLGSMWQDQLQLQPNQDTTICSYDSLLLQGSSPFPIEWMDRVEDEQRWLQRSGEYYFLSIDSYNCILSSDTVSLTIDLAPGIPPLEPGKKPWCRGDTLTITSRSTHESVWSNGIIGPQTRVTESGTYYVTSTTDFGCFTTDSMAIEFGAKPTAKLLEDTFRSVVDELQVTYETNADTIVFGFNGQRVFSADQLVVSDSGWLYLNAKNRNGCAVEDRAFVLRRDLVLRAIPNAFSPNGDGLNDQWWLLHEADSGHLIIFDRWGEVVHYGLPQWDGMLRGEVVPVGEYFFRFEPYENKSETLEGIIRVIR